jgi:hypothetical protein
MAPLEREVPPVCDFSRNGSLRPGEVQAAIANPLVHPDFKASLAELVASRVSLA